MVSHHTRVLLATLAFSILHDAITAVVVATEHPAARVAELLVFACFATALLAPLLAMLVTIRRLEHRNVEEGVGPETSGYGMFLGGDH